MLTLADLLVSWSIVGATAGALSYLTRRTICDALFSRMFDGVLGACVGGEIIRRCDASSAVAGPGLFAAAAGSIVFIYLIGRLRADDA